MANANFTPLTVLAAKRFKYDHKSGANPSFQAGAPPHCGLR